MEKRELIINALNALGITGKVNVEDRGNIALIYVDGEYFGIYDFTRKTFVD